MKANQAEKTLEALAHQIGATLVVTLFEGKCLQIETMRYVSYKWVAYLTHSKGRLLYRAGREELHPGVLGMTRQSATLKLFRTLRGKKLVLTTQRTIRQPFRMLSHLPV